MAVAAALALAVGIGVVVVVGVAVGIGIGIGIGLVVVVVVAVGVGMIYEPSDWLRENAPNPLDGEIKRKRYWLRLPRTQRIRRKCAQAWCRMMAGSYGRLVRSVVNFAIARHYPYRKLDK